ncbi:FMN reductase [Halobacteriales archaeon QH_10_67_13]|nr:MAG: FMN reductase [Halobacteriales archaeon QH_10_67_13]
MSDPPRVAALCGSLRDDSYTRVALTTALAAAADTGAATTLLDLREYDLPRYDPDRQTPPAADRLRGELRAADSVLLGTPMYHGSYASPLKNALDYAGFDEFEHTTVGLTVCRAVNAWVIPHQVAIPNARSAFDDAGEGLADEALAERIAVLGERAVEYASIEPDAPAFASEQNVGADG